MKQFLEPRPTAVTVIGWLWIIIGGSILLSSITLIQQGPPDESFVKDIAQHSRFLAMLSRQHRLQVFLYAAFGILAMISGICFLQLRPWARTVLEFLSWFSIVYVVVGMIAGILWMGDGLGMIVFAIAGSAMSWVPLGFIIRSLRSKKVRDACSEADGDAE